MANRYISGTSTTPIWTIAISGTVQCWDNFSTLGYPSPNDVVYASGKTISIDSGITVNTLTTALYPGGVTAGGGFSAATIGITITANISAGTTTCLTTTHNDRTTTIIGNISANTTTNSAHGLTHSGLGRINVIGNIYGGGPTSTNTYGLTLTSAIGYSLSSCPSVYITGNTYGGSHLSTTPAIYSTSLCLVDITGDCIAGTQFPAVSLSNQNALLIVRGNLVSTTGTTISVSPYFGYNIKCSPTNNQNYTFQDTSVSSANTLFSTSAYTYGIPSTSDVRSGVKYGYLSGLTGTMVIPPFSAVSVGIPVDNGSGGVAYGTAITSIRDIGNMLGGYIG
jgi:hypothetical protein